MKDEAKDGTRLNWGQYRQKELEQKFDALYTALYAFQATTAPLGIGFDPFNYPAPKFIQDTRDDIEENYFEHPDIFLDADSDITDYMPYMNAGTSLPPSDD